MIKLYQSKKLRGNLRGFSDQELPEVTGQQTDPIFSWYGDIFHIKRKMNLIFTNELTKFSILILKYRKSKYPDFAVTFRQYLSFSLRLYSLNPEKYLAHTDAFGLNAEASRSATAHLSRLKNDLTPTLKIKYEKIETAFLWVEYTRAVSTYLTTYPTRKGYLEPADVMKAELEKRQLI